MVDITLKVPALQKLLDYVASGIGAVGGPMLARWKAHEEAAALRLKAGAQADSLRLIASAQADARHHLASSSSELQADIDVRGEVEARLHFQETKRQGNIESIVRVAAEGVGTSSVADHAVDPDWTARFFADAQDVSSEQMQQIWSRILAGEVETPGRTSLRTLSILRDMTQRDARLFARLAPFTISRFILNDEAATGELDSFPSYAQLLHLANIGLVRADPGLVLHFHGEEDSLLDRDRTVFSFIGRGPQGDGIRFSLPVYLLTESGRELYGLSDGTQSAEYLAAVAGVLKRSDAGTLRYASIVGRTEDGLQRGEWVTVEP